MSRQIETDRPGAAFVTQPSKPVSTMQPHKTNAPRNKPDPALRRKPKPSSLQSSWTERHAHCRHHSDGPHWNRECPKRPNAATDKAARYTNDDERGAKGTAALATPGRDPLDQAISDLLDTDQAATNQVDFAVDANHGAALCLRGAQS
eukprot:639334-Pleurochrysis_carterae.AAC.1